jgi:hypothetical protein
VSSGGGIPRITEMIYLQPISYQGTSCHQRLQLQLEGDAESQTNAAINNSKYLDTPTGLADL